MTLESFKAACVNKAAKQKEEDDKLIEYFYKIKEEQEGYGDAYYPIIEHYLFDGKTFKCPHCKERLKWKRIPTGNNSKLYYCNCGYEYAW